MSRDVWPLHDVRRLDVVFVGVWVVCRVVFEGPVLF